VTQVIGFFIGLGKVLVQGHSHSDSQRILWLSSINHPRPL